MNVHSAIAAAAAVTIAAAFAYSGMNVLGAQQLEYRWNGPGEFSFFAMSNSGEIEFCNRAPFWTSIQRFEISASYDGVHMGSLVVGPVTLGPGSSSTHQGTFSSERIVAARHNFMALDFQLDGGDVRLDPGKFRILASIDTPIIGTVPYSSTAAMPGFEWDRVLGAGSLSCG